MSHLEKAKDGHFELEDLILFDRSGSEITICSCPKEILKKKVHPENQKETKHFFLNFQKVFGKE